MTPRERLITALEDAGWLWLTDVTKGHANPTTIMARWGNRRLAICIYAYRVTAEGKTRLGGRRRIQMTRQPSTAPLVHQPGLATLMVGWDEAHGVFLAGDPWPKRFGGKSSSVFFEPATAIEAAKAGWSETTRPDGHRVCAFDPNEAAQFVDWVFRLHERRLRLVVPDEIHEVSDDARLLVFETPARRPQSGGTRVRIDDDIVIADDKGRPVLDGVWRAEFLEALPDSRSVDRIEHLHLHVKRVGFVDNLEALIGVLG